MKTARDGVLAVLLVAFAVSLVPASSPLPSDPHLFMKAPGQCVVCHTSYKGALSPHEFVIPMPQKCWECHDQKELGRSHPIGVDPNLSPPKVVEVPADFPLEDGKVSCGSCHNPHLAFLSKIKAYPHQEATFTEQSGRIEISWFKTLYLRKSDPSKGFEPLCVACHKDY